MFDHQLISFNKHIKSFQFAPGLVSRHFIVKRASVAISMNLFFAGLLSILLPEICDAFHARGTLGVLSILNVIEFILALFSIEETSSWSLVDLEKVYERPKIQLMMWVWHEQLPYFIQKWILWRRSVDEPVPYNSYGEEGHGGESETEM
ncbi:uncharacterized protein FMAN_10773 [Fusarium mangiferae]|uniref:Uncharacterized protein n=1 Tax=Fusarium mangiferae TaxID=192010 RepID=A0A1L7UCG3_FUSMA|nr:uncharacterized protein FMAN_10773 [Fusarium mangiferae]CVL05377.1 uncharacterized protein FMAN_10773 [Fusarium mangiferae]